MTQVLLGNAAPLMRDGTPAKHLSSGTITYVTLREDWDDAEVSALARSTGNDQVLNMVAKLVPDDRLLLGVHEINQLWTQAHSSDPPEWVESDDSELAAALAEFFSAADHECVVGRPDNWEGHDAPLHPPIGGGCMPWEHFEDVFSPEWRAAWREHNLLTNGGRDALHSQHLNTAAPPATFNYMALTANSTAPAAGNTTLTGEIATAGGGLIRAQATYAHTGGTNTTTLTRTFTANGSDSLPVTIAKIGVFNAASSGTMAYETLLNATATLNIVGDNLTVTHTITAG